MKQVNARLDRNTTRMGLVEHDVGVLGRVHVELEDLIVDLAQFK